MKSVLISIQPKWCELIASGKKTVEVRKTQPKLEAPFKVYIYCTGGFAAAGTKAFANGWRGHVIGEFTCNEIECFTTDYRRNEEQTARISRLSCVDMCELMEYEENSPCLYGWHISDLQIYDKPKPLSEFYKCGALSMEDLDEELCCHCSKTDYGDKKEINTPSGVWMCEGTWCEEAYQAYLDEEFALTRPPQSWCYVEVEK
jgi:predicted transcriptional regulator